MFAATYETEYYVIPASNKVLLCLERCSAKENIDLTWLHVACELQFAD